MKLLFGNSHLHGSFGNYFLQVSWDRIEKMSRWDSEDKRPTTFLFTKKRIALLNGSWLCIGFLLGFLVFSV